mmetsp:Transcript_54994/g.151356  ORF Transcript_54994/g.151356 Transcript_54994/m.151356 type:complete len:214 (-) Transcript_54994:712-1353(-)
MPRTAASTTRTRSPPGTRCTGLRATTRGCTRATTGRGTWRARRTRRCASATPGSATWMAPSRARCCARCWRRTPPIRSTRFGGLSPPRFWPVRSRVRITSKSRPTRTARSFRTTRPARRRSSSGSSTSATTTPRCARSTTCCSTCDRCQTGRITAARSPATLPTAASGSCRRARGAATLARCTTARASIRFPSSSGSAATRTTCTHSRLRWGR